MVEENVEEVVETNTYLLSFLEVDGDRNISIEATNILEALEKFAKHYKDICDNWDVLTLTIQQIESI